MKNPPSRRLLMLLPLLLGALFTAPATAGDAPPRGKALYDLLVRGGLVRGGYAPRVTWLPDGRNYLLVEPGAKGEPDRLVKVDPRTEKKTPLIDPARLEAAWKEAAEGKAPLPSLRGVTFHPDGKKLRFGAWRKGAVVYEPASGRLRRFPGIPYSGPSPKLSPSWDRVLYAKGYDLYMTELATGKETPLTEGGSEAVRNGRPDWVYPEELDQYEAFWWSPDERRVAFLRFDERPVGRYPLVHALTPRARLEEIRYPKAGDPNPVVTLHIVDLETGAVTDVNPGPDPQGYTVRVQWVPDGSALFFQRLNRLQNVLELRAADPRTGASRLVLREEEPCFINLHSDLRFLDGGRRFLWSSERTGWRHLYLYDLGGKLVRRLTKEDLPVAAIQAVDENKGVVYFTGYRNLGMETHLFRVGLDGKGYKDLTPEKGSHRVNLAPGVRWFFDTWSSLHEPPRAVLKDGSGKIVRKVSKADTSKLEALRLTPVELVTFKAVDGKTDLTGLVYKPADLDPHRKYPLLVYVYGGPHVKVIRNTFQEASRYQAMAQLGYIVFRMDNRGTPHRGKAFETATYLKLGQVDLADQAAGVKYLAKRPYVDGTRVGITGGSYGGYMTCMALLAAPGVFHAGVAVSSVTDWRNYDTIYTERYMRRPADNPEGYEKGSALTFAKNLEGRLLLVHGTVDNNVHPGNTFQLVQKLLDAGKDYDLLLYPEQRHGIGGPGGRHLRRRTRAFFEEHLKPGL